MYSRCSSSFKSFQNILLKEHVLGEVGNPTKRVGLVQSGPHHHLIEQYPVLALL
jgi:hypothetical protein